MQANGGEDTGADHIKDIDDLVQVARCQAAWCDMTIPKPVDSCRKFCVTAIGTLEDTGVDVYEADSCDRQGPDGERHYCHYGKVIKCPNGCDKGVCDSVAADLPSPSTSTAMTDSSFGPNIVDAAFAALFGGQAGESSGASEVEESGAPGFSYAYDSDVPTAVVGSVPSKSRDFGGTALAGAVALLILVAAGYSVWRK